MKSMKVAAIGAAMMALSLVLSGCTGGNSEKPDAGEHMQPHVTSAKPREVIVRAMDYAFLAPDTVAAGLTTLRLINQGPELHHVWLVRIEEGKTMADVVRALQTSHVLPQWAVDVGGPNTPAGVGENSATLRLEPGNYVMMCVIPSPDGTPHVMKGMLKSLTVVDRGLPEAELIPADIVMTLDDYRFDTDKPIAAGLHTIRIENSAKQPHEVLVVRLQPGKTAMDFVRWAQKPAGPPPGLPLTGITAIRRGEVNQVTARFSKGEYALICFWPDATDGKPHVAHGMVKQFTIS